MTQQNILTQLICIGQYIKKKKPEYIFFSRMHGTFFRIDHIVETQKQAATNLREQNCFKPLFWPHWYETINQLQNEKWEEKHMETKQNAS